MKLGFICLNLPGHLNPMTALARHLQARNHDVVFLYSSGAAGLPFVPSDEKDQVNENRPEVSKMQGEDALQLSVRAVLARTESILKSLPAVVEANGVDALLIDTVQFYAELGAMQLGMPYIHVSGALHFDYSGHTPLCLYGWPHQTPPAALASNREVSFAADIVEESLGVTEKASKADWLMCRAAAARPKWSKSASTVKE
jgi:zeaxanthin glucosyltransferase